MPVELCFTLMSQLADEQVLLLDLLGQVENLLRVVVRAV